MIQAEDLDWENCQLYARILEIFGPDEHFEQEQADFEYIVSIEPLLRQWWDELTEERKAESIAWMNNPA